MKTDKQEVNMKTTRDKVIEVITSFSGQGNMLTIPRVFLALTGDLNSALLLNQIVFWTGRGALEKTIWKTYADWEKEIGLNKNQVEYAKKRLEKLGMIDTIVLRANGSPTVHYRLNFEKLIEKIEDTGSVSNGLLKIQQSIAEKSAIHNGKISKHNIIPPQKITTVDNTHTSGRGSEEENPQEKKKDIKPLKARGMAVNEPRMAGAGFERFWAVYPKKMSRGAAEAVWRKLTPTGDMVDYIIAGVERMKTSKGWRVEGGRFIPFPAKWLEAQGWEDEGCVLMEVSKYSSGAMEWLAEKIRQNPGADFGQDEDES